MVESLTRRLSAQRRAWRPDWWIVGGGWKQHRPEPPLGRPSPSHRSNKLVGVARQLPPTEQRVTSQARTTSAAALRTHRSGRSGSIRAAWAAGSSSPATWSRPSGRGILGQRRQPVHLQLTARVSCPHGECSSPRGHPCRGVVVTERPWAASVTGDVVARSVLGSPRQAGYVRGYVVGLGAPGRRHGANLTHRLRRRASLSTKHRRRVIGGPFAVGARPAAGSSQMPRASTGASRPA